jgi:hypothetical protein
MVNRVLQKMSDYLSSSREGKYDFGWREGK